MKNFKEAWEIRKRIVLY